MGDVYTRHIGWRGGPPHRVFSARFLLWFPVCFTLLFQCVMRRHQLEPTQRVSIQIVRESAETAGQDAKYTTFHKLHAALHAARCEEALEVRGKKVARRRVVCFMGADDVGTGAPEDLLCRRPCCPHWLTPLRPLS